jgi:1-deoxy-D-xylulose-5-phosphate synthase
VAMSRFTHGFHQTEGRFDQIPGRFVAQALLDDGLLDSGALKFRAMTLPDAYIEHDKPEKIYAAAGLDAKGIVAKALEALGRGESAGKVRA